MNTDTHGYKNKKDLLQQSSKSFFLFLYLRLSASICGFFFLYFPNQPIGLPERSTQTLLTCV